MKQEATIDEQEVTQAILDYAEKHGVRLEGMSTKVDVVAGRAGRGVYATISLEPKQTKFDAFIAIHSLKEEDEYNPGETITDDPEAYPQIVGDVTEVEPTIPDDTPVLHTDF